MSTLVDFQLHLLPRSFYDALAAASPLGETPEEILSRHEMGTTVELPADDVATVLARWLDEMERYGVQHAVVHGSLDEASVDVATAVSLANGRISALVTVDPCAVNAVEHAAHMLEERVFRGVLLYPHRDGYSLDGPEVAPVLELLAEHRAPAVVHCGLAGVPLRGRFAAPHRRGSEPVDPLALVEVAHAHPRVNFVIPALGGGLLRETLLVGAECANVLVDTADMERILATSPTRLGGADVLERLLGVFGPGRILFGTGSSTFPRGWRQDVFRVQREALGACGISEPDRSRILGGNALRILGLEVGVRGATDELR